MPNLDYATASQQRPAAVDVGRIVNSGQCRATAAVTSATTKQSPRFHQDDTYNESCHAQQESTSAGQLFDSSFDVRTMLLDFQGEKLIYRQAFGSRRNAVASSSSELDGELAMTSKEGDEWND